MIRYPKPFAKFSKSRRFFAHCQVCRRAIPPGESCYCVKGVNGFGFVHPLCLPRDVWVVKPEDAWDLAVELWYLQKVMEKVAEELEKLKLFVPEVEKALMRVRYLPDECEAMESAE